MTRSYKPHWRPGKLWVFYWDKNRCWVLMNGTGCLYFETFRTLQQVLNQNRIYQQMLPYFQPSRPARTQRWLQ